MKRGAFHSLVLPLRDFLRLEAAGGLLLMAATLVALAIANSGAGAAWSALLDTPLRAGIAPLVLQKPLLLWINDGLMALFFLVVGLELKREMISGHLSSWQRASLPAIAALGGMVAPALIYTAFNHGDAGALRGWAIPTATDIAFALGVLSLLGPRVPPALKAFLLSIAIFDDLGAILIIAVFYGTDISTLALGIAALLLGILVTLNRVGVMRLAPYLLLGAALWLAVLKSGVHATLAGVVLAMCIPLRAGAREAGAADGADAPLLRLERTLHPWVAFGVLPVFALANAAVPIGAVSLTDLTHPVLLGVTAGLLVGKPVGILLVCLLAVRARIAALPEGVNWMQLGGAAVMCGIGFTMSLFIASLAFDAAGVSHDGLERVGILLGTLLSGVAGYVALRLAPGQRRL